MSDLGELFGIVSCNECTLCARYQEPGFNGREIMICTDRRDLPVTSKDGCTLGIDGRPKTAQAPMDAPVTIENHAAVYGW